MSVSDTQERDVDCRLDSADATLPFHDLDDDAFDAYAGVDKAQPLCASRLRGLSHIQSTFSYFTYILTGNYIASYVLAQHRIQAKRYQPRWRNLEDIFVLPMELLVRVGLPILHVE